MADTLEEFLTARLDEAECGWVAHRWAETNGAVKAVFHFGRPLAEEMLADIAIKREIIRRSHLYARDLLLLLASLYSCHPDYNPEWKL